MATRGERFWYTCQPYDGTEVLFAPDVPTGEDALNTTLRRKWITDFIQFMKLGFGSQDRARLIFLYHKKSLCEMLARQELRGYSELAFEILLDQCVWCTFFADPKTPEWPWKTFQASAEPGPECLIYRDWRLEQAFPVNPPEDVAGGIWEHDPSRFSRPLSSRGHLEVKKGHERPQPPAPRNAIDVAEPSDNGPSIKNEDLQN